MSIAKTCRPWWALLLLSLALTVFNNSLVDAKHAHHDHHHRRLAKKTSKKAKKEQAPTASKASKLVASVGNNVAPAPVMLPLLPVVPTPVPSMQDTSRQPVVRPTTPPRRGGGSSGGGGGAAAAPATTTATLDFDNPVATNLNSYEGFAFTSAGGLAIANCDAGGGCFGGALTTKLINGLQSITIAQTSGDPFSLNSFQFLDNTGVIPSLAISGVDSTGTAIPSAAITLVNSNALETFTLSATSSYASVTSVTLTTGGMSFIYLDNISVTY